MQHARYTCAHADGASQRWNAKKDRYWCTLAGTLRYGMRTIRWSCLTDGMTPSPMPFETSNQTARGISSSSINVNWQTVGNVHAFRFWVLNSPPVPTNLYVVSSVNSPRPLPTQAISRGISPSGSCDPSQTKQHAENSSPGGGTSQRLPLGNKSFAQDGSSGIDCNAA